MQKLKDLREKKGYKITATIIKVLLILFVIAFVLVVYLQRFSNNEMSFFNHRMFTVISKSMEPKYTIGDVLFAKEVDPSTIKVGDDISYLGKYGDVRDKIVTHQVVKVVEENGKYEFHTKGLSNIIEDPIVDENQLYGKIVFKSAILSAIYKVISTNIGFYLCIIVPVMIIVGYEIFITMMDKEDKKRERLK